MTDTDIADQPINPTIAPSAPPTSQIVVTLTWEEIDDDDGCQRPR
jgi:hypothetical protein